MLRRCCFLVIFGLVFYVGYKRPPAPNEKPITLTRVKDKTMSMKFSDKGIELLKREEKFEWKPYKDRAGHLTIGYGHKLKKGEFFTTITEEEAHQLLTQDVEPIVKFINVHVKTLIGQNQFDALVMFIYNIGSTAFLNSTVFEDLKNRKYDEATVPWAKWINITVEEACKETGKMIKKLVPVDGLIKRRRTEIQLFNA